MDRSIAFDLVSEVYVTDRIGQKVSRYARRKVYGQTDSITRAEWSAAGEMGLKPDLMIRMFAGDYQGEKIVYLESGEGDLAPYGIYRTYRRRDDKIELYLEYKAGLREDLNRRVPLVDSLGRGLLASDGSALYVRSEA